MAHDRIEWWGFVGANAWGVAREITFDFDEMPQLWDDTAIGSP